MAQKEDELKKKKKCACIVKKKQCMIYGLIKTFSLINFY